MTASDGFARAPARRLTARSVVASTLLGVSPPELPTRSLVATAELLGVAPGTARVAISRMVAAGELEATTDGYRLVGRPLLARQSRQDLSRRGPLERWDGSWRVAIVAAERRPAPERNELRAAMTGLRFAGLRDGVWLRPHNLPAGVLADAEAVMRDRCTLFTARPDQPESLVGRLWALDGWSAHAERLLGDLHRLGRRLDGGDPAALAEGFVVSADVLRHLQADPLLPAELLPSDWPGHDLRRVHRAYDRSFKLALGRWQRSLAARP